jgi:DNA-binding NtrC family response regulator
VLDPEIKALQVSRTFTLSQARQMAVDAFELSYLTTILEQTQGKINLSARKAGVTTRQLSRLLTKHGLNKKNFKKNKKDI